MFHAGHHNALKDVAEAERFEHYLFSTRSGYLSSLRSSNSLGTASNRPPVCIHTGAAPLPQFSLRSICGSGEIRTLEGCYTLAVFETAALDHYATLPTAGRYKLAFFPFFR